MFHCEHVYMHLLEYICVSDRRDSLALSDKTVFSVILCYVSESELNLDLIREETK